MQSVLNHQHYNYNYNSNCKHSQELSIGLDQSIGIRAGDTMQFVFLCCNLDA